MIKSPFKYRILFPLAMLGVMSYSYAQAPKPAGKQPNIIFILVDDQGYGDLGAFFQQLRQQQGKGVPVELSPKLDQMASRGAKLTQYYCAAPICAPSRASLLLGVSQGHANVRDNQFDKALDDNYTMASTLRTLGYSTAAIGKWGLEGNDKYDLNGYLWPAHPLNRGFDYFFGYMRHSDGHEHYPKEALYRKYWAENQKIVWQNHTNMTPMLDKCYTADLWTAAAKHFVLQHMLGKDKGKPFFLYWAFDTPHAVLELPTSEYPKGGGLHGGMQWIGKAGHFITSATGTPDSYIYPEYAGARYDDDDNPSTAAVPWPETYQRYATANRRIDDAVGDMMALLKDLDIDSNTMVIYTSDNGPSKESYLPDERLVPNKPTFFSSYGPFEGIKGDNWEGGIHLPAIAWWPGHIPAGRVIDLPVIAYDWAPTFIAAAGQPVPERMDGVSVMPALTGKNGQVNPTIYIEYKNEETTPDYPEFSANKRGRMRNQMQTYRLGQYVGVRYDIRSAGDDFEIYDVSKDPRQINNLALHPGNAVDLSAVFLPSDESSIGNIGDLQNYFKKRVLELRVSSPASPRPYDSALISPVTRTNLIPGVNWKRFRGGFSWIPRTSQLKETAAGHLPFPDLAAFMDSSRTLVQFRGYIKVPADGEYRFYMSCDARAFLRIHDIQVIDEDYGYPGNLLRTASLWLKAGLHPIELTYYRKEIRGNPFLKLDWSGPGMGRHRITGQNLFREP